jgi:DnaK suppressor protein
MDPSPELVDDIARTGVGIADLERELDGIAESTALSPDDEHDAEGSTVGFERARVTSLLTGARQHLTELEAALERTHWDEPGRCDNCGAVIPPERLAALPATRRCVACSAAAVPERRNGRISRLR